MVYRKVRSSSEVNNQTMNDVCCSVPVLFNDASSEIPVY